MSERQPYSRVYWTFLHDEKYKKARALIEERCKPRDVARETAALRGTWLMLLIQHDQAFPAPGILPASLHAPSLNLLIEVGFVKSLGGDAYEVVGLQAERSRRADAAKRDPRGTDKPTPPEPKPVPTAPQAGPKRDPVASLAEDETRTSQDETHRDTPRAPDPADVYWTLTGRYPTDKALSWIDDLSSSYGTDAVIRSLAKTHTDDRAPNTLLGRTEDALRADARALSLKEQATVRAKLKERRAEPRAEVDQAAVQAEIRRLMEPGAAA